METLYSHGAIFWLGFGPATLIAKASIENKTTKTGKDQENISNLELGAQLSGTILGVTTAYLLWKVLGKGGFPL